MISRISMARGPEGRRGHGASAPPGGSGEQELQVVAGEGLDDHAVVGVEDGVGQVALLLLEVEDLLLDGVAADQPVGEDVLGLADPVRAVDGLGLDGGVPPGVEQVDVLGGGQVQAEAAGLQADQEDRAVGVVLEPLDALGAVAGPAVEVLVGQPLLVEPARGRAPGSW